MSVKRSPRHVDPDQVKIRFSIGAKHERKATFQAGRRSASGRKRSKRSSSGTFDTKNIRNDDARAFAEGILTVFANGAKEVRELINDYETKLTADDPASATAEDADTNPTATESASPTGSDGDAPSPCAVAVQALDLGDRGAVWRAIGDRHVGIVDVTDADDQIELWQTVRDAVRPGGCYPVLVDRDGLEIIEDELATAFANLANEPVGAPTSQAGTVERMSTLRKAKFDQHPWEAQTPIIGSFSHNSTVSRFGHGPTQAELDTESFETQDQVEDFLWRWEVETFGRDAVRSAGKPDDVSWFSFDADETVLLILPVPDGAHAVRLTGFWPTDEHPEWLAALGNDLAAWQDEFGAELVAAYGTMLQFVVAEPPTDLDVAYRLANEHATVATATLPLPGIETRHYAADLIGRTRWHLHDRP